MDEAEDDDNKEDEDGNKDDADEISINEDEEDGNKEDADEISIKEDEDDGNKDDADEISINEDEDDGNKEDADEISINEDEDDGNKEDADEISINEDEDDGKKDDVDEISINEDEDDGNKEDADEISNNEDEEDGKKDDVDEISINKDEDDGNKEDADKISNNEDEEDGNKEDADEISNNEDEEDGKKDDVDEISINEDEDDGNKEDADKISNNEDEEDGKKDDADEISINEDEDDGKKDDVDEISINEDEEDGKKDDADEISINLALSIQCYEEGQYEEAIINGKKCLQMAIENGNKYAVMNACLVIGESEIALKEYENAVLYCMRSMKIASKNGDKVADVKAGLAFGEAHCALGHHDEALMYALRSIKIVDDAETYCVLGEYDDVISYCMRAFSMTKQIGDKHVEMKPCLVIAKAYRTFKKYDEAIEYAWRCIDIAKETADKHVEMEACLFLTETYKASGDCKNTIQCALMLHVLAKETDDKKNEMEACYVIMKTYQSLKQYNEAVQYAEMYLEVAKETADKLEEIYTCSFIAETQLAACNYTEAVKYGLMFADVAKEIGDKVSEIYASWQIGLAGKALGSYNDIIQYATKRIEHETDDQGNKKIGCFLLGLVDFILEKYEKVVPNYRKASDHAKKEDDEYGEMIICYCLGQTYMRLDKLGDAISRYERSSQIAKKIGHNYWVMTFSLKLSEFYAMVNRSDEVESYATIALQISKDLGDKEAQKRANYFLCDSYRNLGQDGKANACLNECVDISRETGDVLTEMLAHSLSSHPINANTLFKLFVQTTDSSDLSVFSKSYMAFLRDALIFFLTMPNALAVLRSVPHNPFLFGLLKKCIGSQASKPEEKEEFGKVIQMVLANLESFEGFLEVLSNGIVQSFWGDGMDPLNYSCAGISHYLLGNFPNAKASLMEAVKCFEFLFDGLHGIDKSKISIVDRYVDTYKLLSKILIEEGNTEEALLVAERCRAKALKDALVLQYGLTKDVVQEGQIEVNDIFPVLKTHKASILFYTVLFFDLHKFVIEYGKDLHFSNQPLAVENWRLKTLVKNVYEELEVGSALRFENCLMRPFGTAFLDLKIDAQLEEIFQEEIGKNLEHLSLKDTDVGFFDNLGCFIEVSGNSQTKKTSLSPQKSSCFNAREGSSTSAQEALSQMLLDNVSLEQEEVVIIPDGLLSIVPFAALTNPATGRYLSEDKKIRFAPSLSTLKVLSESREDFHTLKGAIFIGDPDVSKVLCNGKPVGRLHYAKIEATAIANKFNVTPLTGAQATKRVVLEKLHEGASVVHIAAHGDLNKATILLAPNPEVVGVPKEEDYMLTMAEVQQARVRAQLVVLSCCHSGRGEIRAEGVVGMCRAFLASGARAVVASLWTIDDEATLQFMFEFYDRLQDGESVSTSLQMAMKEMRDIYKEPKYWAPFFLMGDDVNIKF